MQLLHYQCAGPVLQTDPRKPPNFWTPYHALKRGSPSFTYEHMPGEAIGRLRPSGAFIYIWAPPLARIGPAITPRRSLSHRTVWGSYTQRRTYTSGSASRPPGRAAPIPPNTNTSCITRILFFRGGMRFRFARTRYSVPGSTRSRYSGRGRAPWMIRGPAGISRVKSLLRGIVIYRNFDMLRYSTY